VSKHSHDSFGEDEDEIEASRFDEG